MEIPKGSQVRRRFSAGGSPSSRAVLRVVSLRLTCSGPHKAARPSHKAHSCGRGLGTRHSCFEVSCLGRRREDKCLAQQSPGLRPGLPEFCVFSFLGKLNTTLHILCL